MTELADAHCHLDALSEEELESGLRDARAAGISLMVTVGMDVETSTRAVEIAEANDGVYAAVGLHPWLAQDHPDGPPVEALRDLARSSKVVAIGEIGLDFIGNIWRDLSYDDPELQRIQEAALRSQLQLAHELELPVILHCRGAHEPITRILADEAMDRLGGCVQFQEGSAADVERYTALNFTFSVGSSVTHPDPGVGTTRSAPSPTTRCCWRPTRRGCPTTARADRAACPPT